MIFCQDQQVLAGRTIHSGIPNVPWARQWAENRHPEQNLYAVVPPPQPTAAPSPPAENYVPAPQPTEDMEWQPWWPRPVRSSYWVRRSGAFCLVAPSRPMPADEVPMADDEDLQRFKKSALNDPTSLVQHVMRAWAHGGVMNHLKATPHEQLRALNTILASGDPQAAAATRDLVGGGCCVEFMDEVPAIVIALAHQEWEAVATLLGVIDTDATIASGDEVLRGIVGQSVSEYLEPQGGVQAFMGAGGGFFQRGEREE